MTTQANIRVVTVNYGSSQLLERNLAGLPDSVGVVVVDNLSGATERGRISEVGSQQGWEVLTPDSNLGFGDGMNLGIERALVDGAEVVIIVNPDAVLTSESLEGLSRAALSHPSALVAPNTSDSAGNITFSGQEVDVVGGRTRRADISTARHPWLTGACLAFTPEAWRLSGGFAGEYFLYWEDVDLSWSMLAHGGSLHIEDSVTVVHDAGGTQEKSKTSGKSPTYVYYNCRNRLVFAARHLTPVQARRWAKGSLGYAGEVLLRGGSRRVLLSPRHLWAAIRGTGEGLLYLRNFKSRG